MGHSYHTFSHSRILSFDSRASVWSCRSNYASAFSPTLSNYQGQSSSFPLFKMTPMFRSLSYLSFSGSRWDSRSLEIPEASGIGEVYVSDSNGDGIVGSEWFDKLKDAWDSMVDIAGLTVQNGKEASDKLTPFAEVLNSHPYLRDVVVPVGGTLTAALLAWLGVPRILKRLHSYFTQRSAELPSGTRSIFAVEVPYEKSVWGSLEDPVRYLMTFMALSEIYYLASPTADTSQFIGEFWKAAVILSCLWFLQRWKTNLRVHALAAQDAHALDQETLLTLDRAFSVGLFAIGGMSLAEAFGVPVQSILTFGGIGGVATAYGAKDILGNVLSGLSMQFLKPFSVGDTIRAGSIEGQVVKMGLNSTSLLTDENFPVTIPNSTFSNQVIVNKSRAECCAFVGKIQLQSDNLEKIPQISQDIKSVLQSNPKVFPGREASYCYLFRIESSYAELALGCNLKNLSKEEQYSIVQDILLQSIQIIKQHGASLGSATGAVDSRL